MDTLEPRVLDLKKFAWSKDGEYYTIIAITDFHEFDVVVYRADKTGTIDVVTVDEFCRQFTAMYGLT